VQISFRGAFYLSSHAKACYRRNELYPGYLLISLYQGLNPNLKKVFPGDCGYDTNVDNGDNYRPN